MIDAIKKIGINKAAVIIGVSDRKNKFPIINEKNANEALKYQDMRIKAIYRMLSREVRND